MMLFSLEAEIKIYIQMGERWEAMQPSPPALRSPIPPASELGIPEGGWHLAALRALEDLRCHVLCGLTEDHDLGKTPPFSSFPS